MLCTEIACVSSSNLHVSNMGHHMKKKFSCEQTMKEINESCAYHVKNESHEKYHMKINELCEESTLNIVCKNHIKINKS